MAIELLFWRILGKEIRWILHFNELKLMNDRIGM